MSGTLREVIEPVQFDLERQLETEYGLLAKLVTSEVITDHHLSAVEVIVPNVLCSRKVQKPRLNVLQVSLSAS